MILWFEYVNVEIDYYVILIFGIFGGSDFIY